MDGSPEPAGLPDPRQQALEFVNHGPARTPLAAGPREQAPACTLAASGARSELTAPALPSGIRPRVLSQSGAPVRDICPVREFAYQQGCFARFGAVVGGGLEPDGT